MQYSSRHDEGEKKVPSLSSFCKKASIEAFNPLYPVKKIWVPGKFDCFSLVTDSFKFNCYSSNGLYALLESELDDLQEREVVLAVKLDLESRGEFELLEMPNEKGDWTELGDHGFSIRVQDKPTVKPTSTRKNLGKEQTAP